MPFKRKFNKKKPAKAVTKVDKKQDRMIRKIMRNVMPEEKLVIFVSLANAIDQQNSNAMVTTNVSNMGQGTAVNQRVADRVKVTRLLFRCRVYAPQVLSQIQWFRVIIYQDNRYTGTDLTGAQLLASYNTTNTSQLNLYSDYDQTYVNTKTERGKSVKILFDKRIVFGYNSTITTQSFADKSVALINYDKVFKSPKIVNYTGATNATGQIFVATFCGSSTVSTNNPWFSWASHLYYTDN